MSKTASNRGWGGIKAEQVNSDFNPDNKEIFDSRPDFIKWTSKDWLIGLNINEK